MNTVTYLYDLLQNAIKSYNANSRYAAFKDGGLNLDDLSSEELAQLYNQTRADNSLTDKTKSDKLGFTTKSPLFPP